MKYKIDENESGIDIAINDVKDKKEKLLEAFQECQEGRCSCPTEEYIKLESLEIDDNEENIRLRLKSKDGSKIDIEELNKCMEYTENRIKSNNEE